MSGEVPSNSSIASSSAPPLAPPPPSAPPPPISADPNPEALMCRASHCSSRAFRRCCRCSIQYCLDHLPAERFPDKDLMLPYRCNRCLQAPTDGGVSYVVETESKGSPPLGHVVYQPHLLQAAPSQAMTDNWVQVVMGPCIAGLMGDDEERMKSYLMYPSRRKEFKCQEIALDKMARVPQYIVDKRVIVLHYIHGDTITAAPDITQSDLQLVFMIRRAQIWPSRVKEDIDEEERLLEERLKRANAGLHIRLELYVHAPLWNSLSSRRRAELKYFQVLSDDFFQCILQALPTSGLTTVSTRDSFKIRLNTVTTPFAVGHRVATKTVYYFPADQLPKGFDKSRYGALTPHGAPAGVVTYNDVYSPEELQAIERDADRTDDDGRKGKFADLPNTRQESYRNTKLTRTKYFFGARYLWAEQVKDRKEREKAAGVRLDVYPPPPWMKERVESRLVTSGLLPNGWLNSYAINFYHDGTEGLHQHFDDNTRFSQPIFTLRLFSDSRLVFGAVGLPMLNPTFYIPMARGCITVLEDQGYAANAIKHCIRPVDMKGKSAAIILRQIHPAVYAEAQKLLMEMELVQFMMGIRGIDEPIPLAMNMHREGVTRETLVHLTECDLRLFGLAKLGSRRLVMNAIEAERKKQGLAPRSQCSCECNDAAATLTRRLGDATPNTLRYLLLQFPWLAPLLNPDALPLALSDYPLISTQFSAMQNVAPQAAAAATTTAPPSLTPSIKAQTIKWSIHQPQQQQQRRTESTLPSTPKSATTFESPAQSASTPQSSSSTDSSDSTPLSVASASPSPRLISSSTSSSLPSFQLRNPDDFWYTASPIDAPITPLHAADEELRHSGSTIEIEQRGQKRSAQMELKKTI